MEFNNIIYICIKCSIEYVGFWLSVYKTNQGPLKNEEDTAPGLQCYLFFYRKINTGQDFIKIKFDEILYGQFAGSNIRLLYVFDSCTGTGFIIDKQSLAVSRHEGRGVG